MSDQPKTISVKAIDIIPFFHGLFCKIEDGKPFVNPVVVKRWSEDGSEINFMLDSHNFFSAKPDEAVPHMVERAECDRDAPRATKAQQEFLASERPVPTTPCKACGGSGRIVKEPQR